MGRMAVASERELSPLSAETQAKLRRLIHDAGGSAERAARALRLPSGTVTAGAAGVRLREPTRRKILRALAPSHPYRERSHLRLAPRAGELAQPDSQVAQAAAVRIRSTSLRVAADELHVAPEALLAVSIGEPVVSAVLHDIEQRLQLKGEP